MTICSTHKGFIARILLFHFFKVSACHTSQNTEEFNHISLRQTIVIFEISCCSKCWLKIRLLNVQLARYSTKLRLIYCSMEMQDQISLETNQSPRKENFFFLKKITQTFRGKYSTKFNLYIFHRCTKLLYSRVIII